MVQLLVGKITIVMFCNVACCGKAMAVYRMPKGCRLGCPGCITWVTRQHGEEARMQERASVWLWGNGKEVQNDIKGTCCAVRAGHCCVHCAEHRKVANAVLLLLWFYLLLDKER